LPAWLIAAPLLFSLPGCLSYHPQPLTSEAVDAKLSLPSDRILNDRLKAIGAPIRHGIEINGRNGLSPDEAALLAVLVNPSLRLERDKRGIARAQLLQAGLLPNPQLRYAFETPVGGSTTGATNAFGFGLNWEVTALISRAARIDAATERSKQMDLSVAWKEWQVAQTARTALYQLIALNRMVGLAATMVQRLSENLIVMREASAHGLVTGLDFTAAETARNQSYNNLLQLRQQQTQQQLMLNRALGVPAFAVMAPQSETVLPDHITIPPLDRLTEEVGQRRFDLLALRRGYESREAALRVAVLKQFPKISIGFNHARDNGNIYGAGFGVSIDLPLFDRNQGRITLAITTRQQLFDEYVNRTFQARSDIAKLAANINSLNERIRALKVSLPPSRSLVDTYRLAVDQGQADVLNFYIVWNRLTNQRIALLSLKQRLIESRIALELATGLQCIGRAGEDLADCLPTTVISKQTIKP
jgi:outer membrane protein, heavy metal efflux system